MATLPAIVSQNFSTGWITQNVGAVAPVITGGITDPLGGTGAYQIVFPAVGASQYSLVRPSAATTVTNNNEVVRFGVWMRCAAGPADTYLTMYHNTNVYISNKRVTVTSTWQFFFVDSIDQGTPRTLYIGTDIADWSGAGVRPAPQTATAAITVEVWRPSLLPVEPNTASGCIAYWPLVSDFVDTIGGVTGTGTGVTFPTDTATWPKLLGGGALFDAVSDKVTFTIADSAPFRQRNFSCSFWFRCRGQHSLSNTGSGAFVGCFFSGLPSAQDCGWVSYAINGQLAHKFGNAQAVNAGVLFSGGPANIRDGLWHHIAYVNDPNTGAGVAPPDVGAAGTASCALYIDGYVTGFRGGDIGPQYTSGLHPTADSVLRFGGTDVATDVSGAVGWVSPGMELAHIAYWDRCLSDQEVKVVYNNGLGLAYPFVSPPTAGASRFNGSIG